jgi:outer membrane protein
MSPPRRIPVRLAAGAAGLLLLATFPGCAHFTPERSIARQTAPAPETAWVPPEEAKESGKTRPAPPPPIPESWKTEGATLSLAQLVDMALRNNPSTKAAWFQARSKAAELGDKRAAWLPEVEIGGALTRTKQAAVGGQFVFQQTTYGPTASLSYLLLDLGGRQADVDEARQNLFAANWTHDAAIQTVVLNVESAYFQYLNAKALKAAQEASLKEAQQNLDAANARHDAGVATIADVLQAKTALSQARLALEQVEGQIETIRGALATALGFPASYAKLPVDVGELPGKVQVGAIGRSVDDIIAEAEKARPDLASARATVAATSAHVRSVRSEGLPKLSVVGSANRTYYYGTGGAYSNNYSGSIALSFPLFQGLKNRYDLLQAEEDVKTAQAQLDSLRQQAELQVWTSYYNLKTAAQQVQSARDLLESARQSEDVAAGRYREGVGSILDLLTAQSALASARAQDVEARSTWFLALAQLAHDMGIIGTPPAGSNVPALDLEKDAQ